jgi:DNA replication initiation complex subunit (GINS family)
MTDVKITYETLFDLLRREKSREELQKLDPNFYLDVWSYIQQKQSILQGSGEQSDMFGASESEKTKIQLQNIKRIIKELYDKREKKIINMAMNKARTGSAIMDTTALLEEEKELFNQSVDVLSIQRSTTLNKMLALNGSVVRPIPPRPAPQPELQSESEETQNNEVASVQKQEVSDAPVAEATSEIEAQQSETTPEPTLDVEPEASSVVEEKENEEVESIPTLKEDIEDPALITEETMTVKFLSPLPKFVGKEQEVYGPFDAGAVVELPLIIANILVTKGRAEEVKE